MAIATCSLATRSLHLSDVDRTLAALSVFFLVTVVLGAVVPLVQIGATSQLKIDTLGAQVTTQTVQPDDPDDPDCDRTYHPWRIYLARYYCTHIVYFDPFQEYLAAHL